MSVLMSKNFKKKIITKFSPNQKTNNTGASEVQIALLSTRIDYLTNYLKTNKKDLVAKRSLIRIVQKRKKLLFFLERIHYRSYLNLSQELKLKIKDKNK